VWVRDLHPASILASRGRRSVIDHLQHTELEISMSKFTTKRNFGYGKQMDWAGHQALLDIYGRGHFGSVASHTQRWRRFCRWALATRGIRDACDIEQSVLEAYASDLVSQVQEEVMAVSYAQNLIVSANITLEAFRQDKTIRIDSPASLVGRRQTVRTTPPDGLDWTVVDMLVASLRAKNLLRAAVIVLLCRSFGVRLREAILANLADWQRQARERGQIDVREGTKGGRGREVERWVPVSERGSAALMDAVRVRNQLGCGQNLLNLTRPLKHWSMTAKSIVPEKSCTNLASRAITICGQHELANAMRRCQGFRRQLSRQDHRPAGRWTTRSG
jgi:hypothetical protein